MTGIGIIVAFLVFLGVAKYLTNKYHQNFWKLFYWLPMLIILTYFFGSYINFAFTVGILPTNGSEMVTLFSPHGYNFHFVGILIGICISILLFIKKSSRIENKKVWSDILFFSLAVSFIPLGLFLLMGDNFIGSTTNSWMGIKSLHSDSQRNKFNLVYPIGLFLSVGSLFVVIFIKSIKKKFFGYGMLGFTLLLILVSLILIGQQYPRHAVVSIGNIMLDIKQYVAWFVAFVAYMTYKNWKKTADLQ